MPLNKETEPELFDIYLYVIDRAYLFLNDRMSI